MSMGRGFQFWFGVHRKRRVGAARSYNLVFVHYLYPVCLCNFQSLHTRGVQGKRDISSERPERPAIERGKLRFIRENVRNKFVFCQYRLSPPSPLWFSLFDMGIKRCNRKGNIATGLIPQILQINTPLEILKGRRAAVSGMITTA